MPTEKEKWEDKKRWIELFDSITPEQLIAERKAAVGLGARITATLKGWIFNIMGLVIAPFGWALTFGLEKVLEVAAPDLLDVLQKRLDELASDPDAPPEIKALVAKTHSPIPPIIVGILIGVLAALVIGAVMEVLKPWLSKLGLTSASVAQSSLPFERDIISAYFRNPGFETLMRSTLSKRGYSADVVAALILSQQELLREVDLKDAFLRGEIFEEDLDAKLRARGYEDADIATLKKLYRLIPGSTDLIRMAVREVFTPEIVEKFGQMEDFPPVFAEWAAKVGLSEEWAKNYWAAHWDLPSATQGFEMLHRGEITYEELEMLLRALDVMPLWRDKLIKIAYTPYTRVDVRRMHKAGVLDEEGVKRAYLDIGYDEEKATKMTEFTLAYNAGVTEDPEAEELVWTRTEILDAFKRGMLAEEETRAKLRELKISAERIDYYIRRYEVEKEKDLKDAYMARYKKLFVEGMINWPDVAEILAILGLAEAEIAELEPLWEMERMVQVAHPSRADLDRFLKKGIIDDVLYREEMRKMGYSDMYTDWYLAVAAGSEGE